MKNILFIFSIIFITALSSCSMAKLDKYPGTKLDSIPTEFRGQYYFKLGTNSKDPKDSVYIVISKSGWKQIENKRKDEFNLSSDLVFSKVDKYFVISNKDENAKNYWNSWVIIPKRKSVEIYPIVTIKHPNADKLSLYLSHQFGGMNGIDSMYYYKTEDIGFIKYFEKEIKGSKTFEIIRIKEQK